MRPGRQQHGQQAALLPGMVLAWHLRGCGALWFCAHLFVYGSQIELLCLYSRQCAAVSQHVYSRTYYIVLAVRGGVRCSCRQAAGCRAAHAGQQAVVMDFRGIPIAVRHSSSPSPRQPSQPPTPTHSMASSSSAAPSAAASAAFKTGIVKEVPSGDTMVIMGTNWASGPPPTKTVCLAGLEVPRVGRRDTKDEPFAFASREFLRKKVIGKKVQFRIDYVVPGGTRELGVVMLGDENLAETVVAAGWARLRQQKGNSEGSPLAEAAASAEAAGLGLWTREAGAAAASVREVTDGVEDALGVKERAGGHELPAVVEYIMAADRMRILLGPPYHLITFNLSGIKAPGFRRAEDGSETSEPHAREAKFLVERTVLNRDVKVRLEGVDKFNNFFGSLRLSSGENLAETLLSQGMAKCVEWSMKFASDGDKLRAAERAAKEAHLRIFANWVKPGEGPNALKVADFAAVITEVRAGDTLLVKASDGREDTVTLSSVRAPRLGNARREVAYEPWAWECREFLRSYVGKKCMVSLEYKRTITSGEDDDRPDKVITHGTVLVGPDLNSNLALKLCEAGLVSVIRHREDDDRSPHYDDLLTAEAVAQKAAKGLHCPHGQPSTRRFNDLTAQDPSRASKRLPFLKRQGKMRAVVEYCYNGARFKLFIPKEDTFLNFTISSVQSPSTAGRDREAEPYGDEALAFARATLLQRDVYVEVETCNRGGTFIGSLYYERKKSYAVAVLEAGYAHIQGYRATEELVAAEAVAKDAKLKIWEAYVEEGEEGEDDGAAEQGFMEVEVSEINAAGHFYVQRRGDKGLPWVTEQMAALDIASSPAPTEPSPKGTLLFAQWQGDWYRGKVLGLQKVADGVLCRVLFIDYGNTDALPLDALRPMDPALSRTPALATECHLACVKCPGVEEDFGEEAVVFFRELVWGKQLVAKVEYREGATLYVTLFDQANTADLTINVAMLREGLGRVDTRTKKQQLGDLLAKLTLEEAVGKKERLNMWQYGDCYDEDEAPEFGYRPRN
jgi:staphylococcal nuclease domain-containing protein 1